MYFVYMIKNSANKLYVGITQNPNERVVYHNNKRGAKFTKYIPDFEIDNFVIEVKTNSYFTSGTATEKILGCPFKYAEIPELYKKNLIIICVGGAEKICRENYGNLNIENTVNIKKKYINFFKENGIVFIGLSELLLSFLNL